MNRYEDINQIDLVLSMFNQYLFQDCKNNIDDLIYAYQTNMATCGNRLVELLLDSIKTYTLDSIGLPLFQSILGRCGKTGPESQQIINKIVEYKMYTKDQIEPMRKYVKDMIAKTYILRANDRYSDSPSDFINYLKGVNFKSTAVDYLTSTKFGDIDINSIKAEEQDQGIASSFEWINQTFRPECTYPRMGLFCVSMPPGCMAGDTEVFLADGTVETLENLHKSKKTNITVYVCDGNDPKVSVAENCQISKYVNSWYVVEIDGKKEYRVTENHPFLLITGEWKRADKLKNGDILMPFNLDDCSTSCNNNHTVTKVYVETLETPQPVYDLVNVDIYHNYAVKFDETSGFFSHNTGKTLFCMQECLYMCLKGKKCHYLCMGDMTESDFIIRMAAQYFGIPFYEAKRNFDIVYAELKKVIGDRLEITCIPASVITVDEYIEFIKSKDYDVCFCDYDSQFKSNVYTESMYLTYGDIYAKLSELTIQYKKLVFILAQPMKASWSLPVIEIDQVGESARKIHAVDWCLTRGREPGNLNGLGISKIVKSRRGEEQVIDYNIRLNNGRFKSLPKSVYEDIKQVPEKKDYTEAEIDNMINNFLQARGQVQQSLNNKMGNSGTNNSGPNRRGAAPF